MEVEEAEGARAAAAAGGGGLGGGCSAAGPDRLSSLPDCLLHTIMSFMKARQAVQTCVLSTRWRNLWRSVPCLDIDFAEFKTVPASEDNSGSSDHENSGSGGDDNYGWGGSGGDDDSFSEGGSSGSSESDLDSSNSDNSDAPDSDGNSSESDLVSSESDSDFTTSSEDDDSSASDHYIYGANIDSYDNNKVKHKEWEDFEDFTVSLMRRCNIAQLDSFRLNIAGNRAPKFGNRQAAGWLRRAMKYCTPDWPQQLGGVGSGSWHLKSMHLCHVLLDNGFMKRVNSVCLSLENLELDDCTCQIESVTSQSLKTMVLKNCRWRNLYVIASSTLKTLVIDGGSNNDDCVLAIMAPALLYLSLAVKADQFCGGVLINNMPALAKASIHIKNHEYSVRSKLDGDQFKLLCSISNLTSLELSGVGSRVLGKEPRFQKFKNLRNLMLNRCNLSDDFHILVFFLQSSPILEKLTLRHCKFPKYSSKKKGTLILNKTSSSELCGLDLLCENLKVEIIYKYGHGPLFVQLLLRISVNLLEDNIKFTRVN